jgi:hypothetical protein
MPCLPDNPDRDFSATSSNNNIGIDENLLTSLVVGYSELIDDSRVRFRIGEIINRAMSQDLVRQRRQLKQVTRIPSQALPPAVSTAATPI